MSMLIILPPWLDDGLHQTVKRMTPETMQGVLSEINSGFYKSDELDVKIPKFSVSGSLELSQELDRYILKFSVLLKVSRALPLFLFL